MSQIWDSVPDMGPTEARLAGRLAELRLERGWSLEDLANYQVKVREPIYG